MGEGTIDKYLVAIKSDIKRKLEEGFTGNVEFSVKFNLNHGGIGNILVNTSKSIKIQ